MSHVIRSMSELQSIETEWNALAESFGNPLLRHEWFCAYAETFCPPDRLSVVVARRRGRISAIAPLALAEQRGLRQLQLLAAGAAEPNGFLYRDQQALAEVIEAVLRLRQPTVLARLETWSPEAELLRAASGRYGWTVQRATEGAPWLPIESDWAAYEKTISQARRASFRRALKRAGEMGAVGFELAAPAPDQVERQFEEFVRVEAASWKGRSGGALAHLPRLRQFYGRYVQQAARLGILRTGFMRIGAATAAAMLGLVYGGRYWILKIGYDEAFAKCSPGVLLTHETIRRSFEERLDAFEFLGHDEPWIHAWTDHVHQYVLTRVYPWSPAGVFALGLDACAFGARRLARAPAAPAPARA